MGRRWLLKKYDERTALTIAQRFGLNELIGRILVTRGVRLEEVEHFLNPSLRNQLPDPGHLKDMVIAAERLSTAVINKEKIAVFGDYDVDGATSSALLTRFFAEIGVEINVVIPDRIVDGYGPNTSALMDLHKEGTAIVVTVDCGTTSFEPIKEATNAGLDVIVVDHHEAEPNLPKAVAVVNPNRLDENSPHGNLAAVGVTFLLVVAINRSLREANFYANRYEPDLIQWLDLVALGTICDVVPLKGVNRVFVKQGLKVLAGRKNLGLVALSDIAGIDEPPNAYHAGFVLGPRINAGGRVGESELGSRLLSSGSKIEVMKIAIALNDFNKERQKIENYVYKEAIEQIDEVEAKTCPVLIVVGKDWHPGVIGIVASRIKEWYHRPSLVISLIDGSGIGSGRSVRGVDLGSAVIAARQKGILTKGGGHAMAAGFSIDPDRMEDLKRFLNDRLAQAKNINLSRPGQPVDGILKLSAVNMELIETLATLAPFGSGNPEPCFVITNVYVAHVDVVGHDQRHLRLSLTDETGRRLNAIAFGAVETALGQALINHCNAPFHVLGKIRLNTWQGRSTAQFLVEDAATVW